MRVAVLGARGHTGTMLVPALEARGLDVAAHGREVDVTDASSVRAALRGADAVVNLAGPFLKTGDAVIREAIAAGIPYADTTGEQAFMARVRERHDEAARRAGVAIVNALAYEYALADLAVAAHLREGGDALHVLYRSRGAQGSRGTKKTVLRVLAAPALGFEDGCLVQDAPGAHTRRFSTSDGPRDAICFAGGEPLTVPRHAPFRTVRSYVPAKRPAAAKWTAAIARVTLRGPVLALAERIVDARHRPPRNESVRAQIVLEAEGPTRRVTLDVGDPYLATAEVCAEGIVELLVAKRAGVLSPAEALDAPRVLAALSRRVPGSRCAVDEKIT